MSLVRVDRQGDVAELVLAAPPLNLFDGQVADDLATALDELPGGARAVLFHAEGKVFCGGVQVRDFLGHSEESGSRLMAEFLALTQRIEALPVPTVAVVHGLCLTIGFELALACDLVLAAPEASFGLVETTVGLTPGGGGTQRLVARAGIGRATEAVLTGRIYPAEELQGWGVVNRIFARDELLAEGREQAARLAAGPTVALAAGKEILRVARDSGVTAADDMSSRASGRVLETEDLQVGVESLLRNGPGKAAFHGR